MYRDSRHVTVHAHHANLLRPAGPMFADVSVHPLTLNIDLGFLEVVDSIFMRAKSLLQPFSFLFFFSNPTF
jgi:hypothetical protein